MDNHKRIQVTPQLLFQFYSMAKEAHLLQDERVKSLLLRISSQKEVDERLITAFTQIVTPFYQAEQVRKENPLYRHPLELLEMSQDSLKLGKCLISERLTNITLTKEPGENEANIWLIVGVPGMGKTFLIKSIIVQCIVTLGYKVIVIDREGKDFKSLLTLFDNSLYLDLTTNRDPLITCDSIQSPLEYNKVFWDCVAISSGLGTSISVAVEKSEEYIQQGKKPTLQDLLKEIRFQKKGKFGREMDYLLSLESRIVSMLSEGGLGKITKFNREIPFSKLLEFSLIHYDISALSSEQDQYLFSALKLMQWFLFSNYNELEKPILFVIDEGEFLFSNERTNSSYLPITPPQLTLIQRGRKRKLRLLLGTQFPAKLTDETLNPSLLCVMKLTSPKQQNAVAQILGLERDEMSVLDELQPRQALVRI